MPIRARQWPTVAIFPRLLYHNLRVLPTPLTTTLNFINIEFRELNDESQSIGKTRNSGHFSELAPMMADQPEINRQ